MSRLARRIGDKRLLRIIRRFLQAGMMTDGVCSERHEGTPQGGPLSPLLSNLLLDELDKELERRGHKFCRYADDCNIYVRTERAGERVMESVTRFLTRRLRLKVNTSKSAVARPRDRKFLGFRFTGDKGAKRAIAPKALGRFRTRVRELTNRHAGESLEAIVGKLARYLRGWGGYFGFCQTPSALAQLDGWIRRRLRAIIWSQWKTFRSRKHQLIRRGVPPGRAAQVAAASSGPWRMSTNPTVHQALNQKFFEDIGLPKLMTMLRA